METKYPYYKPEVWGGVECTINRVGNTYRDQLQDIGHYDRPGDIENFARMGISKLRYPVLWERHQPHEGGQPDWTWATRQLNTIRDCGMTPIAGLLHHGSGPSYTSLYDKNFPELLASYAGMVALQFPWLTYYTPVNEPLTTARFSGLYGFWYPHHKNEKSFAAILLNQLKGVVLSMQAIRNINPNAKLVQTEDLSKTHSTQLLSYQASFENRRRWLTYDLLSGKVKPGHFFWNYFLSRGIPEQDVRFFMDHPCPPDIIGLNYYVTSERFLDEKIENYPVCLHGGNGRHVYADTEAVRAGQSDGLKKLLTEVWKRYQLPLAITECHLNCTREEQMRWFRETWDSCSSLCSENIKIEAVTAWSLLGSYDWDSLLTIRNGHYEPGVFDVRNNKLRPTALFKMISAISSGKNSPHPLTMQHGWWKKQGENKLLKASDTNTAPVLITGAHGTLGSAFIRSCKKRSIPFIALSRQELDILEPDEVKKAIEEYRPWAVINAAGFVKVDDAERKRHECFEINAKAPGLLAAQCKKLGIRFMTFSSDLVFDGSKHAPYLEGDIVNPLSIYGASKAASEETVLAADPDALIIRTSSFFGPWDKKNFIYHVLDTLKNNRLLYVPEDVMMSPTYVPDLVDTSLDVFIDEEKGIWHVSNAGMLTWADLACSVAEFKGYTQAKIIKKPIEEMDWLAKRPLYSVLESERGIQMPKLDKALGRYFNECIF